MSEKSIERYLVERSRSCGALALKWTGTTGAPDRVLLMPNGIVVFVEVKTSNGRLSKIQEHIHKCIKALGHRVVVVWSKQDVDKLFEQ